MARTGALLRVFIAVKVDEPSLVARVKQLQEDLERAGLRAKYVEPENLHITLRFVGEIPAEKVGLLRQKLREVCYRKFSMLIKGAGAFPNLSRPRVLWLGVDEGAAELSQLAGFISRIVDSLRLGSPSGSSEETFTPHLTIARLKAPPPPEARRIVESLAEAVFGQQYVDSFYLFKSDLTPRGPIYTVIERYALE
uniref:RNA 2',3'-cyclic phosphodiesterase n=1 Tax=Thermofilum pendens TaxID=2269 RepID=A0A7C1T158_THEPE